MIPPSPAGSARRPGVHADANRFAAAISAALRLMATLRSGCNANRWPICASKPAMHSRRQTAGPVSRGFASATLVLTLVAALAAAGTLSAKAQSSQPEALQAVRAAVQAEMQADKADQSIWTYREHDKVPGKDAVYRSIETRQGTLRRMIELDGKPLSGAAAQAETQRIDHYVHDPAAQARARKNDAHDDAQAAEMLKMLPDAFLWSMVSQTSEFITLAYRPNPRFNPPDMQARVMGAMAGQMIVVRNGNRIRTLRGQLTTDVLIGYGFLARLYKGGTFDVERREVGGGHWQITQTNVHIGGHALLFKNIGQQEDDWKTDWKPSPATTLDAAARILDAHTAN